MSTAEHPTASQDRAAGWSEPVTTIVGDRLCAGCGCNLTGRIVAREPRYQLLAATCPHCGRLAPLEEHPAQGAWVTRWAMLIAALWLLVIVAFALGAIAFTVGMIAAVSVEATEGYDRRIRNEFVAWRDRDEYVIPTSGEAFTAFWRERGETLRPRLLEIEFEELTLIVIPSGAATVAGIFWSLALLQRRRRALLLSGAAVVGVLVLLACGIWLLLAALPPLASEQMAWVYMWMPLSLASSVVVAASFFAGLLLARPLARGLVRALVPPLLRGALAFLWTTQGLEPPGPPRIATARAGSAEP